MDRRPVAGEIYRHFKDKMYQIVCIAHHSETEEELVIYQALYGDFGICARPLEMFVSEVDHEKYPEVTQKYRFEKIDKDSLTGGWIKKPSTVDKEKETPAEPTGISDKLMAFFDTDDVDERYQILSSMQDEITNAMIDNMAIVMDIVIPDGKVEDRYFDLKRALATKKRYER